MPDPWVVLKFGGTSVSTPERWDVIARRVSELLPSRRVWIVASALSGVSNALEACIAEASHGTAPLDDERRSTDESPSSDERRSPERRSPNPLRWIREVHQSLAAKMGLSKEAFTLVANLLDDLEGLLQGIRLTREASPRLRAQILAVGELASTRMGIAALSQRGLEARLIDARTLLKSQPRIREPEAARYLEAEVAPICEPNRVEAIVEGSRLVLTQGFIASTPRGETCLLGRGGSDTSASLFAALLGAEELEIWTDVHGLFTADPRLIPIAKLIRQIDYREAQELAAMGAKVLHPRSLAPVAWAGIALTIRNTLDPRAEGTRITAHETVEPGVSAVVCRLGVTMVSLSTLAMWESPGFLARAFAPFDETGISIDLVATSQSAISVTLDRLPGGLEGEPFTMLLERLRSLGTVQVIHPCAVVSIVGRKIRTVLHELGPALGVFQEHDVHLVSESSEDLNLSFVVDEEDAQPLVCSLHDRLFPPQVPGGGDGRFGPTWELLDASARRTGSPSNAVTGVTASRDSRTVSAGDSSVHDAIDGPWWRRCRHELETMVKDGRPRFVYHLGTIRAQAGSLRARLRSVTHFYYSMKANSHPRILEAIVEEGFGLECVSGAELTRAKEVGRSRTPILFTPNFCPLDEYEMALKMGAEITIDGPEVLEQAPALFSRQEVGVRLDPGSGLGHHENVRTAGSHAKFGHPIADLDSLIDAAHRHGVRVVGLHAHIGSGIFDPEAWARVARALTALRTRLPDLRWIDLGGGLGIVERPGQPPLDLDRVEAGIARVRVDLDRESATDGKGESGERIALRMEPGRYLVSEAGVLLAPVTQVRNKGGVRFVGVATGMNSLIRPALYGAWHPIHNLTRLESEPDGYWHVVGPICESGDVLGRDRLLPETAPGDVLLIENCGAYGAVMSSHYNLRAPAEEVILEA